MKGLEKLLEEKMKSSLYNYYHQQALGERFNEQAESEIHQCTDTGKEESVQSSSSDGSRGTGDNSQDT